MFFEKKFGAVQGFQLWKVVSGIVGIICVGLGLWGFEEKARLELPAAWINQTKEEFKMEDKVVQMEIPKVKEIDLLEVVRASLKERDLMDLATQGKFKAEVGKILMDYNITQETLNLSLAEQADEIYNRLDSAVELEKPKSAEEQALRAKFFAVAVGLSLAEKEGKTEAERWTKYVDFVGRIYGDEG